jgi:transcriptional regulator with XRE-family HTH domain
MIPLGKTARYLRERKGLSQSKAAEALGITQVHLSNIENNKAVPSPNLLTRYRDLWGVDLYILAWCMYGDITKLPEAVRGPMQQLADAWKRELGDLVTADSRT